MLFIGLTYGLLSCPKKRVQERRGLSDSIHVQYVSLGNSVFAYSIISAARGARAEQRDSPTFPAALLNSYIINFSYSITVYTRIMGTQMLPQIYCNTSIDSTCVSYDFVSWTCVQRLQVELPPLCKSDTFVSDMRTVQSSKKATLRVA